MSERGTPEPPEIPMVPFAVVGMAIWAGLGLAFWADGRTWWTQICLAGLIWGVPGLLVMLRHDANRGARRS